ncbi:MAG: ABC transporter permease, partial [Candidatus Kapabacteria bacterium]|nr:ABC transporter permease [Candidatus Kapabacteria bacterium]
MNLPLIIALRYLRPRRFSFIGLIGIISMIGIIIGTAALIIVMSLFNGFRGIAADVMTGFGPHIRVQGFEQSASTVHLPTDLNPVWLSKLVIQYGGRAVAAYGVGIEARDSSSLAPLQMATVVGRADLKTRDDVDGAVVAAGLSQSLNLYIGDTITLVSPMQIEAAITTMMMPSGRRVVVRGIFQSNSSREVDATYIYVSDDVMKGLLRHQEPTAWDMRLANPQSASAVAAELRSALGPAVSIETWEDMNRGIYDTMRLERIGSFIVLTLIILVAAFNILVSLTLGVVEKRRDISILKTIGFTDRHVRSIYLYQGFMIGLISVSVGVVVGVMVCVG